MSKHRITVTDPQDVAHAIEGTVAELAAYSAKVDAAVRGLAGSAHLSTGQVEALLGEALLTLDEPHDRPDSTDDDALLRNLRNLVAEADERLADIDGQADDTRAVLRGLDTAMVSCLFDLTDGRRRWLVLAELQERAANMDAEIDASRAAYAAMEDNVLHNHRQFYKARDSWMSATRARMIAAEQDRRAAR